MISFKCYRCRTPVEQMEIAPMRLQGEGDRVLEYMHIYPHIDQETMKTVYKCQCGMLCTYMNMINGGG